MCAPTSAPSFEALPLADPDMLCSFGFVHNYMAAEKADAEAEAVDELDAEDSVDEDPPVESEAPVSDEEPARDGRAGDALSS